jgi:o-succinylbenzoate synthase
MVSHAYFSRYALASSAPLNARSTRRLHEGALIRFGEGFGCIHPWPELGDLSLDEELASLATGTPGPLAARALACAWADGDARRQGRTLFTGPVPESHWLALPGDTPEEARRAGFARVKIKAGPDFAPAVASAFAWAAEGFSLRLDANGTLDVPSTVAFWRELAPLHASVEWIEDPIPWEPSGWETLRGEGIPLALDRGVETRFQPGDIAVIKPAATGWIPPRPSRFLVTSAMDHAVGQMWAASEAARHAGGPAASRLLVCGLGTHRCFEADAFFERVRFNGARLVPTAGTGLGFDDLLEDLPWMRLT